jgi:hypothetical protein
LVASSFFAPNFLPLVADLAFFNFALPSLYFDDTQRFVIGGLHLGSGARDRFSDPRKAAVEVTLRLAEWLVCDEQRLCCLKFFGAEFLALLSRFCFLHCFLL